MQKKTLVSLGIVVAVAALLLAFQSRQQDNSNSRTPGSESGFVNGKNAIYVSDQPPSKEIQIGFVVLEKPGFVAIHSEENGALGGIIGVSAMISAGETKNIQPISLSREARDGEKLFAMLHFDDGDSAFDPVKDPVVQDSLGESLMMEFSIDGTVDTPDAVNF